MRTIGWILAGLLALGQSGFTAADQTAVKVDIEAQRLDRALNAWADQTGYQVLISVQRVVRGRTAPAVKGLYTPEGALRLLLGSSDLTYRFVGERTVAIHISAPDGGETKKSTADLAGSQNLRMAQATPTESTQSSDELKSPAPASERIEEIVVTAQKREERLIDTPQSVSVVSADALARLGATQFRDFANTIPGLSFSTSGAGFTQISLRGVTVGFDIGSTVGVYVDEVPYGANSFARGSSLALDVGLFDLERIEVLRGPQGTLYGASTMGGLLKYVTKVPDADGYSVDAQVGISTTRGGGESYSYSATLNAPVVEDKGALRISGFHSRDGGYIDNAALDEQDVNRADIYGGRIDFLLEPNESLSLRLTGFLQNISREGEATADYSFAGRPLTDRLDQRRLLAEPFDQQFRLASATIGYDLGPLDLFSVSSYQTMQTRFAFDLSALYVPLFASIGLPYGAIGDVEDVTMDKFTQEVRASGGSSESIEWVFGGFYTHEVADRDVAFVLRDLAGQPAPNTVYLFSSPTRYDEYAAFGDVTWHLTRSFDVSGGLRYARNEQQFDSSQAGIFGTFDRSSRSDDNVVTYLANARYRFHERSVGYLRYATGYRPGGPNIVGTDPATGRPIGSPTFEADRLRSYEIGYRFETDNRRWGVDIAAYRIDWSNIQINVIQGGFGGRANAPGGASIDGAELSIAATPTRGFRATGAFAYQDAGLSRNEPRLGARSGERLPNVPRLTAMLSADYELSRSAFRPTVGATLRYVDDRMASFDNSRSYVQYALPEYTTVDLRAGLSFGRIDMQIYARNVFDEHGQLSAFNWRGSAMPAILQPRTIGLIASTRF